MSNSPLTPGVVAHRLAPHAYHDNFTDVQPPLDRHEARVAADRCYFCHDAPCMTACPTSIDIPLFIRQIATGTPDAAAKTIFAQNIMGGMCAHDYFRAKHHGRHVRPCLSDRAVVRRSLRA